MHFYGCSSTITTAKTWTQPKCPSIDEWIKKLWYVYTMEYYSAMKKNEIMPFEAAQMQLEIIILSDKSEREQQIPYDITSLWNLKYSKINLSMKEKQTHRHRK